MDSRNITTTVVVLSAENLLLRPGALLPNSKLWKRVVLSQMEGLCTKILFLPAGNP